MAEINYELLGYQIGPDGKGYSVLRDAYPHDELAELHEELNDPDLIWSPQGDTYGSTSGHIAQRFDVFSHKLSRGDQSMLEFMPAFARVAGFVKEQIVRPLSEAFPSLAQWEADEITAQRYPEREGKLSWHFDLPRHTGIIATLSAIGPGRLGVERSYAPHLPIFESLDAGDIMVQRAPGLFDKTLLEGRRMRQRHAVQSVGPRRTSVTIRANNRPGDPIPGFMYHNWQG